MDFAPVWVHLQGPVDVVAGALGVSGIEGGAGENQRGLVVVLEVLQQDFEPAAPLRLIAFALVNLRHHQWRARIARVGRQQVVGGLERAPRRGEVFLLEQHDAELQVGHEIPWILLDAVAHVLFERFVVVQLGEDRAGVFADAVAVALDFIGLVLLVDVDVDLRHAPGDPVAETGVELIQRHIEHFAEAFAVLLDQAVLDDEFAQLVEAPGALDVVHHEIGLEVGEAEVGAAAGAAEGGIQLGHRQVAVLRGGADEIKPLAAAPVGPALLLLPHRNALRQPARDAVARHLQGDDMGELVPGDFLPIGAERVRRDQRDHLAETDPHQRADVGQAHRARGEVLGILENLDQHRILRLEIPFGDQRVPGFFQQRREVRPEDLGVAGRHAHEKMLALQRGVLFQRVEHREQVRGNHIERVVLEAGFEAGAAFGLLAEADQIAAEHGVGAPVFRVGGNGGAGVFDGLGEAVVAAEMLGDIGEEHRIAGAEGLNLGGVPGVVRHALLHRRLGSEGAVHAEGFRVEIERAGKMPRGLFLPAIAPQQGAPDLHRLDRIGIDRQRPLQVALVAGDPPEANEGGHMAAVDRQGVLVGGLRLALVVFLQEQIAPEHVGLEILRIGADRLLEQAVGIVVAAEQPACQRAHGDIGGGENQAVVVALEHCLKQGITFGFAAGELQQRGVLCQRANGSTFAAEAINDGAQHRQRLL